MGYEIELVLGHLWGFEQSPELDAYDLKYGRNIHEIARIDLSKVDYTGPVSNLISKTIETQKAKLLADPPKTRMRNGTLTGSGTPKWAIYDRGRTPSGNERRVTEDNYGDPIAMIPLPELLAAILLDPGYPDYRRYKLAVPLIQGMIEFFPGQECVALTWGH